MLSKLASYTLVGIDATPVEVEVDVSFSSAPKTVLVGLAEAAVRESTHRVERAIVNSGYRRPIDRVVINLAPVSARLRSATPTSVVAVNRSLMGHTLLSRIRFVVPSARRRELRPPRGRLVGPAQGVVEIDDPSSGVCRPLFAGGIG
jgi:hypothetical protein